MANYKPIGVPFDRTFRNDLNENFKTLDSVASSAKADTQAAKQAATSAAQSAQQAQQASNEAVTKATTTQAQLDDIILENGQSDAEVVQARGGEPLLYERLNKADERQSLNEEQIEATANDLIDRGINIRTLGAKLDGISDDSDILLAALSQYKNVIIPGGAVLGTSKTITVGQGQSLVGASPNIRGYGKGAKIKYIGPYDARKPVVLVGKNNVGAEPTLDGTDIQIRNLSIDADKKAGFCIYGTYLTNETAIENVVVSNSLEYGAYIAKSWYATFANIRALSNQNVGLSFGMPLEYLDGTKVDWLSTSSLEVNNCKLDDIRSLNSGQYFSIDNPNSYSPLDENKRRKGYGIGFGVGNSFHPKNFTSEKSGGVGLYVYNESQPIKVIKSGYLENNCLNAGLDPVTTRAHMIIENKQPTGGPVVIEDVFMKYDHGGIFHTGVTGRKVWLKNIHQPRFLKSLNGLTAFELYAEVLKSNVYPDCGLYNTLEEIATGIDTVKTVDTRYDFTVDTKQAIGFKLIFIKGSGSAPFGSYTLRYDDGTTTSRSFPASLGTTYVLATVTNGNLVAITKSGGTGGTLNNVTFKVVNTPNTFI